MQDEALTLVNEDLELYCQELYNIHNAELQRIKQHHAPKPMPSVPRQEDVYIAPPAYPGKRLE